MKQVYIINGVGGSGKDTFIKYIDEGIKDKRVVNISTVDRLREVSTIIGYDENRKDTNDRYFLSEFKKLAVKCYNHSFAYIKEQYDLFMADDTASILFIHSREIDEISNFISEFNAKTIIVLNNAVRPILTNTSDAQVFNMEYDFYIYNNTTLDDLRTEANEFIENYILMED